MSLTNDQYYALSKLDKWYRKYQHQFIEISGVIGTGTWDLVQCFLDSTNLDSREIMYLSYNQKQVLDLAFKKYHAYFINGILYNYVRIVDFDTIPVVNNKSREMKYEWKKELKKKIDPRYKLIVVFDSVLLNHQTIKDISSFGLPVILIRDPMLSPAPDTYTFMRDANIELMDIHPTYAKSPIIHFAHKILNRERLIAGNYDTVSVVPRRQMNLYNLKSSDMNITISRSTKDEVNQIYREKILKRRDISTLPGERMIVVNSVYNQKIINPDEKKVKVYLSKGIVGNISRINKHALGTKYVPIDFKPEFYHESFMDLMLDRHHLNGINVPSYQMIPDEIVKLEYAYALTADMARLSHWDKVTLIIDPNEEGDPELQQRLLYTAITRAKKSLNIIF